MTAAVEAREVVTHPAGYTRAVRSEWIKVRSLRSTWILVVSALAAFIGFPALLAAAGVGEGPSTSADSLSIAFVGMQFVLMLVSIVGALVATSEFSTGLARTTFASTPRRGAVLLAKATVAAAIAVATGVLGFLGAWAAVAWRLSESGAIDLSDSATLRMLLVNEVTIVVFAVLAVGLGFVLRSSVGTIFSIVGIQLILPIILLLIPFDLANWIGMTLPALVSESAVATSGPADGEIGYSPNAALVVLVLWAVVPMIGAWLSLRARDV